jgi:hypothetical protein
LAVLVAVMSLRCTQCARLLRGALQLTKRDMAAAATVAVSVADAILRYCYMTKPTHYYAPSAAAAITAQHTL